MYAVVITNEGGIQRRLDFSKPELTIGRVQGNDIVLSKRNVSKQHARLSLQDGDAVVVDLNSTNGTWVNGRKITAPQPLKQGDKIYIADFILTLEPAETGTESQSSAPRVSEPPPLPNKPAVPPPRTSMPLRQSLGGRGTTGASARMSGPEHLATSLPPRIEHRETDAPRASAKTLSGIPAADPLRALLSRLRERVDIENIDPAAMKNQDRWSAARAAIAETFLAMQKDGTMHPEVDMRQVAHVALHEAVGLGALDDLLSDQSVRSIVVHGPDHVFVDKGEGLEAASSSFSSENALQRVARRLAAQAGQALEAQRVLHGRLSFGPRVTIVQSPLVHKGPVIELSMRVAKSLEQLAEDGWMSGDAATYLAKAVAECRNIAVVGPRQSGVTEMLSALARELPESQHTVAIEAVPDLDIDRNRIVSLSAAASGISLAEAIGHGTRLRSDRLVINDLSGAETATALGALLAREPGHLLGVHSWSSQSAIEALLLAAGSAGVHRAHVAELIGNSVDIVVAMQRGPIGERVSGILQVQGHEAGDVGYESVPC